MTIEIVTAPLTVVTELAPNVIEVNNGGAQGSPGVAGPQGPSVSDGDKGDIVVSGSGATWTIDPSLLSAFMRTLLSTASEAALKAAVNLEIGVDVQAYSAVLAATTASFLTAHATKLGHISVTQSVDLDAIETRVNALDASVILKGTWDASAGTFPGGGTAQAGESWIVSVAGTVDGIAFAESDRVIAILDNASTTVFASNWFKADYTDQVLTVAGKSGTVTLQVADITDMSANGRSLVSAVDYAAMKTLLSLGNVTNTSDANKPVSTAQQAALDLKAPLASPTFSGVVTTAGQIAFPATQNPSANANTLDDYEEGTWTPVIIGLSTAGVGTYSTQIGNYTKIGNRCLIDGFCTWTAHTGTGDMALGTLPFSVSTPAPASIYYNNLTYTSQPQAIFGANVATRVSLRQAASGAGVADIPIDTAATISISGQYLV